LRERLKSFIHSLGARNLKVSDVQGLGNQVFKVTLRDTTIPIYMTINTVQEYQWFRKHELEDHALKSLELEGKASKEEIKSVAKAEEYLTRKGHGMVEVIRTSSKENIAKALNHITTLLNHVLNDP